MLLYEDHMSTPLNSSVLKAFQILGLFSEQRPEISATIVAQELGLNSATAHRFLLTLEEAGALRTHKRGVFTLGETVGRLAHMFEKIDPFGRGIHVLVTQLSHELGESVMACRIGRVGPVCVAVATAKRPISMNIDIGSVLSMRTAQGKLWLAQMDTELQKAWRTRGEAADVGETELALIRAAGYARNSGETLTGIGAVCVPLHDPAGRMVLSLSAFGLLEHFNDAAIARMLPSLRNAAEVYTKSLTN